MDATWSMICWVPLVSAVFCGPIAASATVAPADPLADCDVALASAQSEPDAAESERQAIRCYYQAARRGVDWDRTSARLTELRRDERWTHWATLMLAHMASDEGDEAAESLYHQAIDGFTAAGNALGEVHSCIGLATFVAYDGRFEDANAALDRAAAVAAEAVAAGTGEPCLLATVQAQRARQQQRQGDNDGAIALLEQIEPVVFPEGEYQLKLLTLHVLSGAYWERGRFERAWQTQERMVELCLAEGDHHVAATVLVNHAELALTERAIHDRVGRDEVIRIAEQALDESRIGHNVYAEAGAEITLGKSLGQDGIEHLRRGVALYEELGSLPYYAHFQADLALGMLQDDPEAALRTVNEALASSRTVDYPFVTGSVQFVTSAMLASMGRLDEARESAAEAVAMYEIDVGRQWLESSRAYEQGFLAIPYYHMADLALFGGGAARPDPAAIDLALATMEQVRGRTLLQSMASSQVELPDNAVESLVAHAEALAAVSNIQRTLRDPDLDHVIRADTQQQLERAEADVILTRQALARAEAGIRGLGATEAPTVADIQAVLSPAEALVMLQLSYCDESLWWLHPDWGTTPWALVVTTDTVEVVRLGDIGSVGVAARQVGDLVRGRDGTEGAALAAVSAAIFQPTLAAVPPDIHRLIVIPDGGLNRLPLAALPVDDAGTTLSRRFTLTITPSASLYLALQGDRVPPGGAVLALADPALDDGTVATLRGPSGDGAMRGGTLDWERTLGERLGSLPRDPQA